MRVRRTRRPPATGSAEAGRRLTRRHALPLDDNGVLTAFVALLLTAIVVLMGLVVDGGNALAARQSAYDEAEQAARTGAGALSIGALRTGSIVVDPRAAVDAATAYTVRSGHPGTVTLSGETVTVRISYRIPTEVLGIIGIRTIPVTASASAVDVAGVTTASQLTHG